MRFILLFILAVNTALGSGPIGASYLNMTQVSNPSAPAVSSDNIYFKSDNLLYKQTSGNVVSQIGTVTSVSMTVPSFLSVAGSPITASGTLAITASLGNLTDAGTDGITITGGTSAIISNASISQRVADTSHNGYLSSTDWNTFNSAAGGGISALTGDVTATGPGAVAATLATVNGNVGSFGSSTSIPSFTVNGKGLITAASGNAVVAPAGTLTGTTLAANVVTSSLISVGTLTSGTWHGSVIGALYGGTGGNSSSSTGIAHVSSGTWSYSSIVDADVASNAAIATSKIALTVPTVQKFLSSTGTYTKPAGVLYIHVRMVGGGGGGAGADSNNGVDGVDTTFGTSLLTAGGGKSGNTQSFGGNGGTASLGTGPIGIALSGGYGASGINTAGQPMGNGGVSPFGGAGAAKSNDNGFAAIANTGSGGAGGSVTGSFSGGGGGAGGYVDAIITSPASSYTYVVGGGGAGGSGTKSGGAGGSGLILVEEYYQ